MTKSKYMTPDLEKAAAELQSLELVDERMERLKAIWPVVKDKLDKGVPHKKIYEVVGRAVAGPTSMKLPTFSKMLSELYARGKKRKPEAAKAAEAKAKA